MNALRTEYEFKLTQLKNEKRELVLTLSANSANLQRAEVRSEVGPRSRRTTIPPYVFNIWRFAHHRLKRGNCGGTLRRPTRRPLR
jgi:hypothetical protein